MNNINEITLRLNREIEPYLGQLNYGNLRKTESFPEQHEKEYIFMVVYENCLLSTNCSGLYITENESGEIKAEVDSEKTLPLEKAVDLFISKIKDIPNERMEKTKKDFKTKKSFEKSLAELCKNRIETEIYTEQELKILREYYFKLKRIVVAEDNKNILVAYEHVFDMVGKDLDLILRVDYVENGEQLVTLFKEDKEGYNLIITDHNMPKLTGLEASKQIRELDKEIPICILSGDDLKDEALEAGANEFLEKPPKIKYFEDLFKKYFIFQ
ncbi:MAG: response regulator [Candidatus Nanoarchaeia archaeon]|nr:response regulator [Candidatus Nanoarchaeia archaeon]MDD5588326.1 response regulator [Candidatus Nanoarchaeia archaeon]